MKGQEMRFWTDLCPQCRQGRLFVTKEQPTGLLFLLCEECETSWAKPEDVGHVDVAFDFNEKGVADATAEDIADAGWGRYRLQEAPDYVPPPPRRLQR